MGRQAGPKRINQRTGRPFGEAKFRDDRESWLEMNKREFIMYVKEVDVSETGVSFQASAEFPQVSIMSMPPFREMSLTALTVVELEAFKAFINRAIDKAAPTCAHLDEVAKQAWEDGDDSFSRSHRALPRFTVRQRREPQHSESVPSGPGGAAPPPQGGTEDGNFLGIGRERDGALPDSDPGQYSPQDDPTSAD